MPVESQIDGRDYLRLIGIAALVGIPAALVAVGFLQAVHLIEGWLWYDLPIHLGLSSPPWYLVVGLPVVGAALGSLAFGAVIGPEAPLIALDGSTTMAVEVGTAAGMAAVTRLLFASLIFSALLVGPTGADTIPAAVLAAASAWLVASAWERRMSESATSFYH